MARRRKNRLKQRELTRAAVGAAVHGAARSVVAWMLERLW